MNLSTMKEVLMKVVRMSFLQEIKKKEWKKTKREKESTKIERNQ